nr:sulfate adenylyltransferase subunit CysN [uncultured Desulfuromonas sp.]
MTQQPQPIGETIRDYLNRQKQKDLLRFITCGSVDDGKSTLIGRLLHDSKTVYEDQLAAISQDSRKSGTTSGAPDLALLVDGLQSEREQGITIDVAYRYFSTDKRKFIIADTPGHEQYTRNMATGASTADVAILLIDARHGVQTQTRRHSFIVHRLGIRQVIVAVNKMDLVDYSQQVFESIVEEYRSFAEQLGIPHITAIPLSALSGDNVVSRSDALGWYDGKPLLETLETLPLDHENERTPFRFPVQYINRPHLDFRGYCGTIASGQIRVGDTIVVQPSGQRSTVKEIITFDGTLQQAATGDAVTLTLTDEIDISRGNLLAKQGEEAVESHSVIADLVWMDQTPLIPGHEYWLKRATTLTPARIDTILSRTDVNTLQQHEAQQLALNEIGRCQVEVSHALAIDRYEDNATTGSFILIDRVTNNTVAAGMIVESLETQRSGRHYSPAEIELNRYIRTHYPEWGVRNIEQEQHHG